MRADLKDLHARFYAAFKQAESAIKSAEHAGEDLPIPCINELRYAGYHHIRSDQFFADGFHEKAEEEMRKAIRHTERAHFDISEFYVSIYSEKVKVIIGSYRGYEYLAARHIPNYSGHIETIHEIGNFLETLHTLDKASPNYVEHCKFICRKLKDFIAAFRSVEGALLSEIAEKESGKKISWIQCLVSAIIGFLLGKFF